MSGTLKPIRPQAVEDTGMRGGRRKGPRFLPDGPRCVELFWVGASGPETTRGLLHNLGEGGICVDIGGLPPPPRTLVRVEFGLGEGGKAVVVATTVAVSAETHRWGSRVRLAFRQMDGRSRTAVADAVGQLAKTPDEARRMPDDMRLKLLESLKRMG